jgi:FKBP-type peptidyl-prolyl cis-trans isomerase
MGDLITINFSVWIIKDSSDLYKDWTKDTTKKLYLIGTTDVRHIPVRVLLDGGSFVRGSDEGIAGMKVGGQRTIIIPSYLAYGVRGYGPILPNSNLKLQVQLLNINQPVKEWDVDTTKLLKTKDGIKYAILQEGTGPKIQDSNIVTVNYSGYLIDGRKFDSSVDVNRPFVFKIGMQGVLPGWEEAMKLLNKGAKARIIIPPMLAYGEHPLGKIPPNSTLIFDVEVLDVR